MINFNLTEEIIKHIFSGLLIINSEYINSKVSNSLVNNSFSLKEKIKIETEDGIIKGNVYGCQASIGDKEIKILLGNCSQDKNILEYCLLLHLQDAPMYGLYLVIADNIDADPLISTSLDGKSWMVCSTYLQATFLAGMEQLKDYNFNWVKVQSYDYEFEGIISFLQHYNDFYGENNEGQEN